MRATRKFLALALLTTTLQPALAGTVTLDFEDAAERGQLSEQFKDLGLHFTGNAWGVNSQLNGCGSGLSFDKPGSCGALILGNPADRETGELREFTISVDSGFIDMVSFTYGQRAAGGLSISVFGSRDGTGQPLALLSNLLEPGCDQPNVRFCGWEDDAIEFQGTAYSITFSGFDKRVMLDDLSFTTRDATNPNPLPEPASMALALGALGALGWTRRRASR
ncbi:hypothetical protein ACG02S_23395 [Roseateles sp. DC23W]|uniref:PEP-CTERM protein-sorting domain-containing protein n=1 Tax=Pelomonas dachongensis TaxID=3299029 RepID=A0ABW7ETN3_9BURK